MRREQFLRELKNECSRASRNFEVRKSEGKGSHYRVYVDGANTIVKSGELSPGYMRVVRKQLGL